MKKIILILKLFPVLLTAVQSVEEAIPLPSQGKRKLDLVLDVLKEAFDASTELSQSFSWVNLVAAVVPMIAKIVDLHNELGLFTKGTPSKV